MIFYHETAEAVQLCIKRFLSPRTTAAATFEAINSHPTVAAVVPFDMQIKLPAFFDRIPSIE